MALKKAPSSDRHPAERTDAAAQPPAPITEGDRTPDGGVATLIDGPGPSNPEPELGSNVVAMTSRAATAPGSPRGTTSRVSSGPAVPISPDPVATQPRRTSGTAPTRPAGTPAGPQSAVRRVEVTKRGKRDYNYSWPKEDLAVMRQAWEKYRVVYRRHWTEADPGGTYRLTQSAFWGQALMEAFKEIDPWLPTIRNDARKDPLAGGREQVGLVWPVEVENAVVDLWETIDKSRFPDGFSLTKQHLAAAAILHGLKTADAWVLTCRNDDRYNVPVEADGRLRGNKGAPPAGEDQPVSLR